MSSDFFDLLLFSGAVHGLIFNIVTLTYASRKKITKSVLYLNFVVLSISLNNLQAWMISKGYILPGYVLRHFEVPWYFFVVPMFYFFVVHFLKVQSNSSFNVKSLFLIFGLELCLRLLIIIYSYHLQDSLRFIELYTRIEEGLNAVISLIFFVKSIKLVFKNRHTYSHILSFDSMVWLRNFIRLGGVVFLLWLLAIVLNIHYTATEMYYPLRLGSSLLIYWMGYQGLIRYHILRDRIQLRSLIKTYTQGVTSTQAQKPEFPQLRYIIYQIEAQKLFLNPYLSIAAVAETLGMSVSKLSKIINSQSEKNFPELINAFRIQHATALLSDPRFDNYTIVAIGLESGFNSKSAFYTAFKKQYDLSPSDYRNRVRQ